MDLLPDLSDAAKCGGAQAQIVAMIANKEAELVDYPTIITKSGQRAISTNVRHVRYATRYSPAKDPVKAPEPVPPAASGPAAPAEEAKKPGAQNPPPAILKGLGVPGGFESNDVGISFEAEPTVQADGLHVDLQVASQHSTLLGWTKITIEGGGGKHVTVEQPDFQTLQTSTNIVATSGGSVLLGLHKLQPSTQQVEVFILTTTVIKGR